MNRTVFFFAFMAAATVVFTTAEVSSVGAVDKTPLTNGKDAQAAPVAIPEAVHPYVPEEADLDSSAHTGAENEADMFASIHQDAEDA